MKVTKTIKTETEQEVEIKEGLYYFELHCEGDVEQYKLEILPEDEFEYIRVSEGYNRWFCQRVKDSEVLPYRIENYFVNNSSGYLLFKDITAEEFEEKYKSVINQL